MKKNYSNETIKYNDVVTFDDLKRVVIEEAKGQEYVIPQNHIDNYMIDYDLSDELAEELLLFIQEHGIEIVDELNNSSKYVELYDDFNSNIGTKSIIEKRIDKRVIRTKKKIKIALMELLT